MATTTANQGIPIPVEGDSPDVPRDFGLLALFLEKQIVGIYTSVTDRNTRATSPIEGQMAFTKDANLFWVYDGAAWQRLYINIGTPPPAITSGTTAPSGGVDGDVYLKV